MSNKPDFAKLFAAMASMASDNGPTPLPEAVVVELQLRATAYTAPVTFLIGDLVTVRAGSAVKGAGTPHIVIDVNVDALPVFEGERGSNEYGKRNQIRVLTQKVEHYSAFWLEAAELEYYTLPVSKRDDTAPDSAAMDASDATLTTLAAVVQS